MCVLNFLFFILTRVILFYLFIFTYIGNSVLNEKILQEDFGSNFYLRFEIDLPPSVVKLIFSFRETYERLTYFMVKGLFVPVYKLG